MNWIETYWHRILAIIWRTMVPVLAAAGLVLIAATVSAQSNQSVDFEAEVASILTEGKGHKAGLVVFAKGKVQFAMHSRAVFRIASVSKIVIALAALKFFDDRNIPLSTPVKDLLPTIAIDNPWALTDPIRLIHLLEHTSGLHEVIAVWPEESPNANNKAKGLSQILAESFGAPLVQWPPGTTATYSNYNYVALNAVVEHLSGESFDDVIAKIILHPLGMTDSTFRLREVDRQRLLPGYFSGTTDAVPLIDGPYRSAAGMYSSPRDLGFFIEMLLSGGEFRGQRIVDTELVEALQIPISSQAAKDGLELGHGPGGVRRQVAGRIYSGHNGMIEGYAARLFYSRERQEGYAVLFNTHPLPAGPSLSRVGEAIEKHFFSPYIAPQKAALPMPGARPWLGFYRLENPRFRELVPFNVPSQSGFVTADGDKLWFKPILGNAIDYVYVGDNQFRRPHEVAASLIFGDTNVDGDSDYMFRLNNKYYKPASAWAVVFGLVALLYALSAMFVGWFASFMLPFVWRGLVTNKNHRSWLCVLTSAWLFVLGIGLATQISTSDQATSLHGITLLLSVVTGLIAIVSVLGFAFALRTWMLHPCKGMSVVGIMVACGQLLFTILLAPYGWLPLVLWR